MKNSVLKIALSVASFLFYLGDGRAQIGLQIGVEGTPQFSWLYNQDDRDSDDYSALATDNGSVGISSQWGFTENIGIGLNVLYSWQGQQYEWNNVDLHKKLQYVKIPLTFNASFPAGANYRWILKVGPQLGILTDAKIDKLDGDSFISDQMVAYRDIDFGGMLSFGPGFNFAERLSFDIAVRGDAGIINAENEDYALNIHNPRDATSVPGGDSRAMTSNMTIGLTFGFRYTFM